MSSGGWMTLWVSLFLISTAAFVLLSVYVLVGAMRTAVTKPLPREAREVLRFWFLELKPEQWWKRDAEVDRQVKERFGPLHDRLRREIPPVWLKTARGRLAAIIVLDQFSRNIYRDDRRAFVEDGKALTLAEDTIERGLAKYLSKPERKFLYMPFQHSEDKATQAQSVALFETLDDAEALEFARKHKEVIDRFGRFPHRNKVLGRKNKKGEAAFLKKKSWFW